MAIPFHVFQLTGSAAATGLTVALEAAPALLVGPWAGVLLDRWNLSRAMWLADLASYLLSAAIIATLSHRVTVKRQAGKELQELKEGINHVRRNKILKGILLANGVFLTANAGATALLVPFTVDRLNAPGYTIGYLFSGLGAGFLLGAAISPKASTWQEFATSSSSPK